MASTMNRFHFLMFTAPIALIVACSVQEGHPVETDAGAVGPGVGGSGTKAIGTSSAGGSTITGGGGAIAGGSSTSGTTLTGGGSQAIGGSASVGGTGINNAGGSSAGNGTVAAGGTQAVGGASGAGGNNPTSSTPAVGGAGGVSATVTGVTSTGGVSNMGGGAAAGGTTGNAAIGGIASTGGTVGAGGVAVTGGAPSAGGAVSTGGAVATGGMISTGGTNSNTGGGVSTGGAATGGSTAAGGSSGSGCTGSFETIQSGGAGLCVAKMVPISAPSATNDYSIDATEVTKGQYDLWLATNPALPASTDANCNYVTSYAEQGGSDIYSGTDAVHHPVVYVDWCDAYAYCKGVGKRLCGKIGGGTNATASYADATLSQWYRACSSGGADTFPYGNTYSGTTCDGSDYWNQNTSTMQTVAVGSLGNCVTATAGYAGAYDLSGNVWEWEDSCSGTGNSAFCFYRGGAFNRVIATYDTATFLSCDDEPAGPGSNNRIYAGYDTGFRCCSP